MWKIISCCWLIRERERESLLVVGEDLSHIQIFRTLGIVVRTISELVVGCLITSYSCTRIWDQSVHCAN
jgi:hypothetical protein